MADKSLRHKTNTRKHTRNNGANPVRSYIFMFGATFAGVAFGVLASLGMMRPILQDQVASATKGLSHQIVAAQPASSFTSCVAPTATSGGAGGGQLLGAETAKTSQPAETSTSGGKGGEGGSTSKTVFVHKLISGVYATTTGTNSMTGPGSTNIVKSSNTNTTRVENHNDITATNNNQQTATSGNVTSHDNTSAGQATSGDASNSSQATFDIKITN